MRIKQLIIHSNLSKMKNKILSTCLQGNYKDSKGEFSNASYDVFGAERVKDEHIPYSYSITISHRFQTVIEK